MEFLIRGYFGTLGMTALAALSAPLGSSGPEGAEKRLSDLPLVGTIFQPNDASGIINTTYERMKQINTVKETYEGLLEKGRTADAEKYLRENINEMSLASVAGNFRQTMGEITKYENAIKASNMSPEEKRQQLDQMRQLKIQIAKAVRELAGKKEPQSVPA
jgi:DNA integrity scanning protein DisA with diadenylate cyclase activity